MILKRSIAAVAMFLVGCAVAEPFRVMTYNVWLGFNKKQHLEEGAQWIAAQDCDVLALQELKGFNQERLAVAAKKWGHDYVVIFDRKGGFPQGLTSKTPIELVEQIMPNNDPKLRGTLHCKTAGMHFLVVHFDPRNLSRRKVESAAVVKRVRPLLEAGEKVIVLGDFNDHSAADKPVLQNQSALIEKWRAKEKKVFNDAGELDFSVLQGFFDAGLVDLSKAPPPTFPSRLLFPDTPKAEFGQMGHRIDFILVSQALAGGSIRYPRDGKLDAISDHYPVILELKNE